MKNAGCENMDLIRPSGTFPCGGRQSMSLIRYCGATCPCGGRQNSARHAIEAGTILSSKIILSASCIFSSIAIFWQMQLIQHSGGGFRDHPGMHQLGILQMMLRGYGAPLHRQMLPTRQL